MSQKRSLSFKISMTMISVVVMILLIVGLIFYFSMRNVSRTLIESNREMGRTSSLTSQSSMTELTLTRLQELADSKATIANNVFVDFEQCVLIAASAAEKIYSHPELYRDRPVPVPDASHDGELAIQVLYASDTDPDDPAIRAEMNLIGNIQDVLLAVNENSPNMASNYIATESGIMVQADYISAKKFDENGKLMPINAKSRPWYQGAAESGQLYLTPVTRDAHTPQLGIMCGVPIYRDGQLVAVSGAGMYLDQVDEIVRGIDLGYSGEACIINQNGNVILSTFNIGTMAVSVSGIDLRTSENPALAEAATKAVAGEAGIMNLAINDIDRYLAYAPMKTVGWSFLVVLSQAEVQEPTVKLQNDLDLIMDQALNGANAQNRRSATFLILLLAVAILTALAISWFLSNRISKPIRHLTDEVQRLQGDDLDFICDIHTGDETEVLATSFESLTTRMKDYISDIRTITAERERIGTELSLATRIQEGMLPSTFPPFPDRHEFDLFAVMDPAKEVGGDFYDFFLIDEDHLCLVMADVSGKGVPAALFMMASKIILANNAMMGKSPAQILASTNHSICSNNREEMFVTVWLGILELSTGKLTAANAGHEYPVLKKPDGRFELVKDKHGFVIGGLDDSEYSEYEWQLEPGSKLFIYTDGVPEAGSASTGFFGTGRMLEALNRDPDRDPRSILQGMREAVDAFVGDIPQFDDLTMLCLEYHGGKKEEP